MNIAVIGGAGFVGSALVKALIARGNRVVVFDSLSRGQIERLPAEVPLVQMDARNLSASLLDGTEWVFDLAARVYGVRDLYKDPAQLLVDNMTITAAILKASAAAKVPNYFFVSSSCVYDFPGANVPHVETDTDICDTSYGFGKVAGEQLVKWFSRQYGFSSRIARLFNVYGPGDSFQSPHVIPEFIRKAEAAKTSGVFPILGAGNQTRDFTYMDDCISGLLTIMESGADGEAYNVGTGREISIQDLAGVVLAAVGAPSGGFVPQFVHEPVAKEDIQRRAADNSKLRALGWNPLVSLEDGVKRLIPVAV